MNQHIANLKQVALDAGERKSVHPVAQVIPHPGMIVLVEVADRDPFAEKGRIEEPNQPPALTDALTGWNRPRHLAR